MRLHGGRQRTRQARLAPFKNERRWRAQWCSMRKWRGEPGVPISAFTEFVSTTGPEKMLTGWREMHLAMGLD